MEYKRQNQLTKKIQRAQIKKKKRLRKIDNFNELYEVQKELGKGQFGSVHFALDKVNGNKCAIKIVPKEVFKNIPGIQQKLINKISILG